MNKGKSQDLDIIGLSNLIMDITFELPEYRLKALGFRKGILNANSDIDQRFYDEIRTLPKKHSIGGSPANVVIDASMLGIRTALYGSVGKDELGKRYSGTLKKAGIEPMLYAADDPTAKCYVIITPDGERTMLTRIGAAKYISSGDFSDMPQAKIFHTSGYELVTNPYKVLRAIDSAYDKGMRISFDLADGYIADIQKDNIEKIIRKAEILFASAEELKGLTGYGHDAAIQHIRGECPIIAFKKGKDGSIVFDKDTSYEIPVYETKVVNTCGAGDAYAAGFLCGQIFGMNLQECGHLGSYIASRVCSRAESNLFEDAPHNAF